MQQLKATAFVQLCLVKPFHCWLGVHKIRSQVSPCSRGLTCPGRWEMWLHHKGDVVMPTKRRGWLDPCVPSQCLSARYRHPSSNQGITAALAAIWVLPGQKAISKAPPAPSRAEDLPQTSPQQPPGSIPKQAVVSWPFLAWEPTLGVAAVQCVIRRYLTAFTLGATAELGRALPSLPAAGWCSPAGFWMLFL